MDDGLAKRSPLDYRQGVMVLQDMPCMYFEGDIPGGIHRDVNTVEKQQFEAEFKRMIEVRSAGP